MVERHLQAFALACFGVVMTLFLVFPPAPIVCGHDGRYVPLPWGATAEPLASSERDLEIHVTRNRGIFVGPYLVPRAKLASVLRELATRDAGRRLLLIADGSLAYAEIEDVVTAARDAGFRRLALVTFSGPRIDALQRGAAL